jgi:hypothetical protein
LLIQERVCELSLELAEYFILWTSLKKLRAAEVLELYRLRWQIELVFKRMKSIFGLGHLPKKDPLIAVPGMVYLGADTPKSTRAPASGDSE